MSLPLYLGWRPEVPRQEGIRSSTIDYGYVPTDYTGVVLHPYVRDGSPVSTMRRQNCADYYTCGAVLLYLLRPST